MNDLGSRSLKLIDLLDYQEGAVVSRTIVKKPTGTVTLFAFDAGEGLSEHTAPFDALVQIIEGEVNITISGQIVSATAGELVIMPANQPHSVTAKTRLKMLLTMIRS